MQPFNLPTTGYRGSNGPFPLIPFDDDFFQRSSYRRSTTDGPWKGSIMAGWLRTGKFTFKKLPKPKREVVFQPSFFRGFVKLRGGKGLVSGTFFGNYITSKAEFFFGDLGGIPLTITTI